MTVTVWMGPLDAAVAWLGIGGGLILAGFAALLMLLWAPRSVMARLLVAAGVAAVAGGLVVSVVMAQRGEAAYAATARQAVTASVGGVFEERSVQGLDWRFRTAQAAVLVRDGLRQMCVLDRVAESRSEIDVRVDCTSR